MKRLVKLLFSRVFIVVLLMIIQLAAICVAILAFREQYAVYQTVCFVAAVLTVIFIMNQDGNSAYKISWVAIILIAPVFGVPLYIMFGTNRSANSRREEICGMRTRYYNAMRKVPSRLEMLEQEDKNAALQAEYLQKNAAATVFRHTETEYYRVGEDMFAAMLEELQKARRFIFLEYFIIEPGVMWDSVLDILAQKVHEGVDVRVIYDDMGCISRLPSNYCKKLLDMGIKCCVFRRFHPVLNGTFNNRDHRKICVVDGAVAFTGGINLADEYINSTVRFGHWLDCGVKVRGDAAYSFTLMFLSMWDHIMKQENDPARFVPYSSDLAGIEDDGYVQPYSDTPVDDENVGMNAYLNMINRAKRYIYICTPYLVVNDELMTALTLAAKSGVDVRLMAPGVPDKKYVYSVTRSYYTPLTRAGVKIYEYVPGFLHSKSFVCDDEYGICGSVNLDFRSLYLHHECAVWMYKSKAVGQMKRAFIDTIPKCREISYKECVSRPLPVRLWYSLLRLFAPLM